MCEILGGDYYAWDITPDGRFVAGMTNKVVSPGRTHAFLFRYDRETGDLREFDLTRFNKWLRPGRTTDRWNSQPTSRLYHWYFDGWITLLRPDGRQLLLGGASGYRYVWAFDLEKIRPQWYQKLGGISSCALWIPEKRWWLHGDTNGDLRVFTEEGRLLYAKRLSYVTTAIARGFDSDTVFVFGHESYVRELNLRDFAVSEHPSPYPTGIPGGFAIAPSGHFASTGSRRQTYPPYPYIFYRRGESGQDWRITLFPADAGSVFAFPGGFAFCGIWLSGAPVKGLSSSDDVDRWICECGDDYYLKEPISRYYNEVPIRPTEGVIARDYEGNVLWELIDPNPDDDNFWAFESLANPGSQLIGRTYLIWRQKQRREDADGYEDWLLDRFYEMTGDKPVDTGAEFVWQYSSKENDSRTYFHHAYIRDGRLRLVARQKELVAYRMPEELFADEKSR